MKTRKFICALLKLKNVAFIVIWLSLVYSLDALFPGIYFGKGRISLGVAGFISGTLIYLILGLLKMGSKEFDQEYTVKGKIRNIHMLINECSKLINNAKKYANSAYIQKIHKVMGDKDIILNTFMQSDRNYTKEKIVEQALYLIIAYARLVKNYCIRLKEIKELDVREITNRINVNTRKLNFTEDIRMSDDIRNIISMDKRILDRVKEEKKELERIGAKLDYMESAIVMFKHQIICNIESKEMFEKMDKVINEATALDLALEYRRSVQEIKNT